MPINTHHGPPGTYKTSGAIQDDLIKAIISGRPIITNVRGLDDPINILMIVNLYFSPKNKPVKQIQLCHLDTAIQENKEKMARFFDWAPKGAYFLIDEINTIFPSEQTVRYYRENYRYRHGDEQARLDDRPIDILEAFEMHRHHNWDFTLTTPNISKVHKSLIRDVCEIEFRHKNRATIGLPGYWEIMHHAGTSGQSQSDILMYQSRSIRPEVFDLYKSTTTGEVKDTTAGRNVFLQPKNFIYLAVLLLGVGYFVINNPFAKFYEDSSEKEAARSEFTPTAASQKRYLDKTTYQKHYDSRAGDTVGDSDYQINAPLPDQLNQFLNESAIFYVGKVNQVSLYSLKFNDVETTVDSIFLHTAGVTIKQKSVCIFEFESDGYKRVVTCAPKEKENRLIDNIKETF